MGAACAFKRSGRFCSVAFCLLCLLPGSSWSGRPGSTKLVFTNVSWPLPFAFLDPPPSPPPARCAGEYIAVEFLEQQYSSGGLVEQVGVLVVILTGCCLDAAEQAGTPSHTVGCCCRLLCGRG